MIGLICAIGAGVATGVGAIAEIVHLDHKVERLTKELGVANKNLKDITNVTIEQALVEKAMIDAATEVARDEAYHASAIVRSDIRRTINEQVGDAVANAKADLNNQVLEEMRRKVARIDIADMEKRIRNEAKEDIKSRLRDKFDDILDEQNAKLEYATRIYSSIEKTMRGDK